MAGGRQSSALGVNRENSDTVVAAVRAVQELARRMDLHFRGRRLSPESLRKGGNRLNWFQNTPLRIVIHGRDRRGKLVDDIGMPAVGMEGKVARPRAGSN